MLNCIYDCDYCYLQGMFPSAHVVVFVNQEDFIHAISAELNRIDKPIYLALSYDTDLLAFEGLFGFARPWIEFVQTEKRLSIEMRTKSANITAIKNLEPNDRTILAWSLSPQQIIDQFEKKTASLKSRVDALNKALIMGWPVRLCIDPIIRVPKWQQLYSDFLVYLTKEIDFSLLRDISVGSFRMNHSFLKRMKQQRNDTPLLFDKYEIENGAVSYPSEIITEMYDLVSKHFADSSINKKLHFIE